MPKERITHILNIDKINFNYIRKLYKFVARVLQSN